MKKVISASRRIDMVGNAPEQFVAILNQKCPPESVHTLVIWTKNVRNLFDYRPLFDKVRQYDQLFVHYTVTGMGGTILEPRVPGWQEGMGYLEKLVQLAGDPERIRLRFDPIVHLTLPDGADYCNLPLFETIAALVRQSEVKNVSISWMSEYRKIRARLQQQGIVAQPVSDERWRSEYYQIKKIAEKFGLNVHGCCVPGMPRSRCIDGELFMKLHPKKEPCSLKKATGQRASCGCTESWDIGWYHPCWHGCLYCYANPMIAPATKLSEGTRNFY